MQIETRLHERSGQAVTNFCGRLPAPLSDLARESLKDPYRLDFLGLGEDSRSGPSKTPSFTSITRFLLELGAGFAFVGRQAHLEVGGEDFSSTCCSIT
jgi:predicted nuclease of restriction endonuclease-like (RecB) superfamily